MGKVPGEKTEKTGKVMKKGAHGKPEGEEVKEKCVAQGCKHLSERFGFCDEHYDHFKFGLIKKTGQQVSDYERKFDHYLAFKASHNVRKVA